MGTMGREGQAGWLVSGGSTWPIPPPEDPSRSWSLPGASNHAPGSKPDTRRAPLPSRHIARLGDLRVPAQLTVDSWSSTVYPDPRRSAGCSFHAGYQALEVPHPGEGTLWTRNPVSPVSACAVTPCRRSDWSTSVTAARRADLAGHPPPGAQDRNSCQLETRCGSNGGSQANVAAKNRARISPVMPHTRVSGPSGQ